MDNGSRRLVVATGLAIAIYGMAATVLGTLLPELSKTLTPAQSGTMASVQSVALILASFATGPAIQRAGAKAGVLAGLTLLAAALLFLTAAHTYLALLLAMAGLGLGGGVISTSTNTLASQLGGAGGGSGGTGGSRMLNLLNVFFGLGGLATPALGAFLSPAALCRVIVLFAAVTLTLHALTPALRPPPAGSTMAVGNRAFTQPLFLLLCLFLFLYVGAEVGMWNWLATFLTSNGMPRDKALHMLSFGFAAGIITGRLVAAKILARYRPANVTLVCSVLMALATAAVLAGSAGTAGIAIFCAGLAMAPVYPTTLGMVAEAFPKGAPTAIGVAVTMGWIGVAVSSKIIGSIAGDHPERLGQALLLLPAVSVLMIVVNLVFRRLLPPQSAVSAQPQ